MKKKIVLTSFALMIVLGIAIVFYPNIRTRLSARTQAIILEQHQEEVEALYSEIIANHFRRANEVNFALSLLPEDETLYLAEEAVLPHDYMEILNIGGVMARLSIPIIDVDLPVFHTTNSDVLEIGVGHLEGTSFPIGGEGTHAVLTAHTALPIARLFSDLEHGVDIGDIFHIHVLDQRLTYEVDQIIIVLPHEVRELRIIPDEDFVTLMTCTPYALNTHRLLVRGRRISS